MAFVFTPDPPVAQWVARLDEWLSRSPGFFVGRPIVLDLANVKLSRSEILNLIIELLARNVRVIGLENADAAELGPELPPLLSGRPASVQEMAAASKQEAKRPPPKQPASLLIEHPVRSGQSIVFLDGDVSVLGSVASGAEVAAGGSIHVYGTLRGRAMAGHMGNPRARIFCQKIEAELLAIDGRYRTADEIDPALRGRPTQVWLDGDKMMLTALN